jgi:hypothetical protein
MTMANRSKDSILTNQVISKLLDSPSVKVPENSAILNVLNPTAQRPLNYADTRSKAAVQAARQWAEWRRKFSRSSKRATKTDKVLILIAWVLLVLNVLSLIGSLEYGPNLPLSLRVRENTNGLLFQTVMLTFGAFVLSWISWLYLKNRAGESIAVPLLVIIALAIIWSPFIKASGDGIANIRGVGRAILCSLPTTTTPMYRFVTAILYSEDKPSAVIGNQIVHEGDIVQGLNVVKIYKNKVEFEKNGRRWTQSVEKKLLTY